MATRLTFLIDGRDQLSRVLDRAGDSATRMQRRLTAAAVNSDAAMRRLGASTTQSMAGLRRDTDIGAKAVDALKGALISLAPAAVPMAASLAPIAPAVGAATVATTAYAAALGPQVMAMSEASEAEEKYTDAVKESGRTSEAAATAQMEYARTVADLPPATRRAAAGLSVLKDEYKEWSDSLAADTMGPVNKGLALFTAMLPATTGLVKGTSAQLDRFVTILAGGMASPGLDGANARFTEFATGTMTRANSALVRFVQNLDTGQVGGGVSEFMDYARAQGPVVASTLKSVGEALMNILEATSEVGVGMLQVVNGLAGIVAAVPPGAIATMLQLAIAIKAVGLAAAGLAAGRAAVAAFGVQLLAMNTAAAAAPGRMAGLTAAWGAMSRGARLAAAGTGVGLLVIALLELSQVGQKASPDIDKMTSSLGRFAQSGKAAGEMARVFGEDLSGLMATLSVMSSTGKGADFFEAFEKTPVNLKEATKEFEAIDKSLAALVSSGKADLAAAGLARMKEQMAAAGNSSDGLNSRLTEYQDALAASAFEQELVAQSMGLFGAQAQDVQAKLDAQKASTDGLRQSIIALNEVNRAALDGRAGMEAAIDAASEATKKHSEALKITNGELNLNSAEAREAQGVLTELARKTEGSVTAARESGRSWEYAKGQYDRGREALIRSADAMGLNREQAVRLADQILKTPNKTAYLKGDLDDLRAKLADAKARLKAAPSEKTARIKGEISDLQRKIAAAQRTVDSMRGKTITITTRHVVVGDGSAARRSGAHGSQLKAAGGPIRGPGTGTSDDVPIWASNGEYMIRAAAVTKYGMKFMHDLNAGLLPAARGASSAGPSVASAPTQAGQQITYNVYPRASVISVEDLRLIQRQEDARQRVGRPR